MLSNLSFPYTVAITELETELNLLISALQSTGDIDPHGLNWKLRARAFDPEVQRHLENVLRIYGQTSSIRFSETIEKKPTSYHSIRNMGCVAFPDGTYEDRRKGDRVSSTNRKGESLMENSEGWSNPVLEFETALARLKCGFRVARKGWNGKGMWLRLQRPDAHSKMTHPYIYIEYPEGHPAYPNGSRVPWLASQTDLMAEDWMYYSQTGEYQKNG